METNGENSMQSYPDPTENSTEHNGPFYSSANNGNTNGNGSASSLSMNDELRIAAQLAGNDVEASSTDQRVEDMHNAQSAEQTENAHQYQAHHLQQHLMEHSGMSGPGEPQPAPTESYNAQNGQYASDETSTPARKRSKVSRACDECRRKKIRCDATSENGDEQCSNCKRVGTTCQFSRVPMKRGPSKGYIKELADRLHTLESHVHVPGDVPFAPMQGTPRDSSHEYTEPMMDDPQNRKRGYSAISNDVGGYQPRQSGNWNGMDMQPQIRQPAMHDNQAYRSQFEPNGMAPQPSWRDAPEHASFAAHLAGDHLQMNGKLEWDDSIIDSYYLHVHTTFPLLPHNKRSLATRIQNSPPLLQQAFYETINAVVRALTGQPSSYQHSQALQRAAILFGTVLPEDIDRSKAVGVVFLQTLLLLVIEVNSHGPSGVNSQAVHLQSMLLGAAVGLAYSMRLHLHNPSDLASDPDRDSDDKLARRCWWTLVILDRLHASSTNSPLLIPDTTAVILTDDQSVLGESMWHLARLSIILGHTATVLSTPGAELVPFMSTLLNGELQRFREAMPDSLTRNATPMVFLAFWHLRLLIQSSTPSNDRADLINQATPGVAVLAEIRHRSPLDHYFSGLAMLILSELYNIESTRDEAERCLKILIEVHSSASTWDTIIRDTINQNLASGATNHASTAAQGLQHLADLATAGDAGRNEAVSAEGRPGSAGGAVSSNDPTSTTRSGFFSALGR